MNLQKKTADEDLELDMSPMIDMVFLLLIFFIVASQIIDEKPEVTIPDAAYGKVSENQVGRLMITVQKQEPADETNDEVHFYIGSNKQPVDLEIVKQTIEAELSMNEKLKVQIRADGRVSYEKNEMVTRACAEVGAQDLIYSVYEE